MKTFSSRPAEHPRRAFSRRGLLGGALGTLILGLGAGLGVGRMRALRPQLRGGWLLREDDS